VFLKFSATAVRFMRGRRMSRLLGYHNISLRPKENAAALFFYEQEKNYS
jgi:hypothetical protein